MTSGGHFAIDLSEEFPHLRNAPIREAVLEIRTSAGAEWQESTAIASIKSRLSDYTDFRPQTEFSGQLTIGASEVAARMRPAVWRGVRAASPDQKHVVQFNRAGFIFSRLRPYEAWERFKSESMRLWAIHQELGVRAEIERVGLRFINAIAFPEGVPVVELDDYIRTATRTPEDFDLPLADTFVRDTLTTPGYPYAITIVRTVRRETKVAEGPLRSLIIDIDVFTVSGTAGLGDSLEQHLERMRVLKNRAFFGTITQRALKEMQ